MKTELLSLGFAATGTGGGCEAYERVGDGGEYILITDGDLALPEDDAEYCVVSIFEGDGDEATYERTAADIRGLADINRQSVDRYGEGLNYRQIAVFLGDKDDPDREAMLDDWEARLGFRVRQA